MKIGYSIETGSISVDFFTNQSYSESENINHCHDRYEITLITSASGKYIIEGSEHKICPGALIFMPPLTYHKVMFNGGIQPQLCTIHFSQNVLSPAIVGMLNKITDGGESSGKYYSPGQFSDTVISVFDRLDTAEVLQSEERSAYLEALLSEIIILLSASDGDAMTHSEDELGSRVAKYLNENIDKNISLEKLARRFFVSKYHLCRAFKKYSGISVHSYINHKRIMYAKQLIESGETASGAAERVGFGDYSAFYRAYVRIVGKSPTKE